MESTTPATERHTTPQSLRDLAYETIKHRIITCAFRPGEYINEAQVSAVLGLGRTPVHQAIDRLMLDGMVEVIPRKGVIVKPVSLDEILHIIEARLMIEPAAIRLATARADDGEISALGDILGRAQQWSAVRNVEQMMLLDREFHLRSYSGCQFAQLLSNVTRLWNATQHYRRTFMLMHTAHRRQVVNAEHGLILDSIRRQDPVDAERYLTGHIRRTRIELMTALEERIVEPPAS